MERTLVMNDFVRIELIHQSLKFMVNSMDHAGQLRRNLSDLARTNDIPLQDFMLYFPTLENFLLSSILRAEMLFNRHVKSMIETSTFKRHDKICYFLRCVERFFEQYPEIVCIFKMNFTKELLFSDIYDALAHFFASWRDTLFYCFQGYSKPLYVSRIIQTYLTLLKGQLVLADMKNIIQQSSYAGSFLTFVTYKQLDEL